MGSYGFYCVPLKTTSEVDFVKPMNKYIDTIFNKKAGNRSQISDAVTDFNTLRTRACCGTIEKTQESLDLLTRYYDQLVANDDRFRIPPSKSPLQFKWTDAFSKGGLIFSGSSLAVADVLFDRVCVLFNCAALMSHIAAAQRFNTDEEIKQSARLFQQAAGIFAHLKDNIGSMLQANWTSDLMPDTFAALEAIMVAQAQEMFYIKGCKENMKSAAMVKVSAQLASYYSDAQKLMSKDNVKGLFEKKWFDTISGKYLAYQALGQFHHASENLENKEIAEQLARLAEAVKLSEKASSSLSGQAPAVAGLLPQIREANAAAVKDNTFIYFETPAKFDSLPSLPKAAIAKPTPIRNPLSPNFKDLFECFVPLDHLEAKSSCVIC